MNLARWAGSGAVAGAASAFAFAVIHDLLVSDIWFSVVPMMIAGVLCGASLSWTYAWIRPTPTLGSWVGYSLVHLAMLGVLGLASILVYDPVTSLAAVIAANAPPNDLIVQALPLTGGSVVGLTLTVGRLYASRWQHYVAITGTSTLVMTLLGLNISAIGLVDVPSTAMYLIGELFVLTAALVVMYAVALVGLQRRFLSARPAASA
jgi:hypothetical protein